MNYLKDPRHVLILSFVVIIAAVPVIQMVNEARAGNGIRVFELFSQSPTAENLRSYEHSLEEANWLGNLSRPLIQFVQFEWLKDGGEKVAIGRSGWYFYKPGVSYKLARHENPKKVSATNDPIAAIVDFRDQLALRGINLVVVPVPDKESIYPDRLTSRADSLRSLLAPRTEDVLTKLRAVDVEVIDLFEAFRNARHGEVASSAEALYLAQDTHWSPAGVQLAAQTVGQRLKELHWVQPGTVEYTERRAPVRRLGDVLRMLRVPEIERMIKPEEVPCAQVIRQDSGQPYKDEAEAEILVLGDSFTRIYQQDEPQAAGFVAHLAKELKQPLMTLVNDGGGSTIVREELRARPAFLKNKKVVIWEFVERDIGLGLKGWKRVSLGAETPFNSLPQKNDSFTAEDKPLLSAR